MKSDFNEEIPKGSQNNTDGSTRETIIASVICGIILLVPMIYIEYEYDLFGRIILEQNLGIIERAQGCPVCDTNKETGEPCNRGNLQCAGDESSAVHKSVQCSGWRSHRIQISLAVPAATTPGGWGETAPTQGSCLGAQ